MILSELKRFHASGQPRPSLGYRSSRPELEGPIRCDRGRLTPPSVACFGVSRLLPCWSHSGQNHPERHQPVDPLWLGKARMEQRKYVSRGGYKLEHALSFFGIDVEGFYCADFGCSHGGFTDCLLQHGAAGVIALDTGYGILDYSLRNDPRVTLRERTNVLHCSPPSEPLDLVVADMGWTRQSKLIPVARRWIDGRGRIVSLVKPHYEVERAERKLLERGVLPSEAAERIFARVLEELPQLGVQVLAETRSPILGGGSQRSHGNVEYFVLLSLA